MKNVKVGLLPFYVALYDATSPEMRPEIEAYYRAIAEKLRGQALDVLTCPVCRLEEEFSAALRQFHQDGAQAVITLHLAYSPSLESARPLAKTPLPLIVLDTTPDDLFDPTVDSARIMYNHGIHGVQDMCNLLRRNGKPFVICAGHATHSDVLKRVSDAAHAAAAWFHLSNAKVGMVGDPFQGMGDFQIAEAQREQLGIQVVSYPLDQDTTALDAVRQEALEEEYRLDRQRYRFGADIPLDTYFATERVGLAIRAWIRQEGLTAFSMNFQAAGTVPCFPTMPFSEACKAMSRGIGYAGEGDALTAAFVGALLQSWPDATFAEMFCPNWRDNTIFFSHMGEFNPNAADGKPHMIVKDFPFAPGFDPTCIMGHMKPGRACFANLAPTADGFRLVLAEGEMQKLPERIGSFENSVSGWFKPDVPLCRFLEEYSRAGGTHHGVLVYGATAETLRHLSTFGGIALSVIA